MIRLKAPFMNIEQLNAGDKVMISGLLYVARDQAHKRMVEQFEKYHTFPVDIRDMGIYYAGPCPSKPGQVIGSIGPTTSGRMDKYAPVLLDNGLKIMIGKGNRDKNVIESMIKNKAVYIGVTGGIGALISKCITSQKIIAYDELGAEALREIYVEDFPGIVIIDAKGHNLYD
ncbi:MAG: fumarate hydratase C-terminal domain-containing protein [Clostridia bacterium]|nr:fumarate hydratase C-terminal domain-containing protein [Clostridia bacterium]